MKLEQSLIHVSHLELAWQYRRFALEQHSAFAEGAYVFDVGLDRSPTGSPVPRSCCGALALAAELGPFSVEIDYSLGPEGAFVDEAVSLEFHEPPVTLTDLHIGMRFDTEALAGYTATPVPFRVGLDGRSGVVNIAQAQPGAFFAEGWVIDNGADGLLVMRVPDGSPYTCFVPLVIDAGGMQVGSIGPDGESTFERSPFLDVQWQSPRLHFPATRFVFFRGDWKTGYELFRGMVEQSLARNPFERPACPITYNTFHDFGPSYDRARLLEAMPELRSIGFGMLHLDPGWETVWGSNEWNDQTMGSPESFVEAAGAHGLQAGCWTSVHTTDPEVHGANYTLDSHGSKYLAEDFTRFNPASVQLWGVCPASEWASDALRKLSRLGKAGFRFLNSDFHDWPWSGESCHSSKHCHSAPLTRPQWVAALSDFYRSLHAACPGLTIEMHDHAESGAYRTPVWYLYDLPGSYDEKWAYEFMWTTYQDLLDRKLFALYYMRLAEPLPFYLHINAASDNDNALAFWYVASCVTHIGVGAILGCSDSRKQAYRSAFERYNARFDAFTRGRFHGIDELAHVHVYPDRRRAVVLVFNLEDEPLERTLLLDPEAWGMESAGTECRELRITVPPKDAAIVDVDE